MQRIDFLPFFRTVPVLLTLCLVGCGGVEDRPATVPVTGSVAYKGEAVEGATVSFWTEGAPRAASGVTDKDGKFQLSMFEINDGAVPGEHVVTVTKANPSASTAPADPTAMLNDPTAMTDMMQAEQNAGNAGPKSLVPEKYGNKSTSDLRVTVKESDNAPFVLQLTD